MSEEKVRIIVDRTKVERELENENNLLREKLAVLDAREQAFRDMKGLENVQRGGGVVPLHAPHKKMVYPSIREGISDLYKKADRGDQNAKDTLRKLWNKSREALMNIERNGIQIVGCPRCNAGLDKTKITSLYNGKCPNCDFDLVEFRNKGGEW